MKLLRHGDQIHAELDGETKVVRLVWARPISTAGREIALLDEKKREVALLPGLDALDPTSRQIAEEELRRRYLLPRITRVLQTRSHFGTRYWHVETNHGVRRFVVRNPNHDIIWLSDDHLVLRDPLGNRFEIPSLAALDSASRAAVNNVT
ncbi:MAG: hypothetical protein PCFJNLEI_03384 [Verrucomicrobiae bacterium]|nr:hypothetical protein [Verrucomicrobiae bacterium]